MSCRQKVANKIINVPSSLSCIIVIVFSMTALASIFCCGNMTNV